MRDPQENQPGDGPWEPEQDYPFEYPLCTTEWEVLTATDATITLKGEAP